MGSMKEEIGKLVDHFIGLRNNKHQRFLEMEQSGMYSDTHLLETKEKICNDILAESDKVTEKCKKIVKSYKENLNSKLSRKPTEHNILLNNALTLINTAGETIEEIDIMEFIAPFKHDYKTMLMFYKLLKGQARIQLDLYNQVPEIFNLLDKVYNGMEDYFKSVRYEDDSFGLDASARIGLIFAVESIESKADDLLNAIDEW